jgi:hypothetical protein
VLCPGPERSKRTTGRHGERRDLVKGVVMMLSAIALSIKPGGSAREIEIAGGIKTNGSCITPIEQHGAIDSLRVTGGFVAAGGWLRQKLRGACREPPTSAAGQGLLSRRVRCTSDSCRPVAMTDKPIGDLRRRMIADMIIRTFSMPALGGSNRGPSFLKKRSRFQSPHRR